MRHLRLFPAVRERCGAGCRCGRSALRRNKEGRERTAPRRQARQGGRGANNLHLRKSNHRITRLSCPQAGSRPPCGTDVRSRGFVAGRCRRALREYPGRHSTGAPCRRPRLHPGVCISDFSRFPRRRETSSGTEGGGRRRLLRRREDTEPRTAAGCTVRKDRRGEKGKMSSSDIYLFRSRRKQVALAVRPSAVPNGIRSVPSGKSPCTGRVFACRRRERKPRIGAGGGTGPNLGRVHSAAVGRRRTADIGGGAISNFPGNGRTESSVSGETGRDPRLARKSPRSGNIRNAPKASGEGGRIFGPRTRCAGTKRPPRSAERIRRNRTRSAPRTQIAEKRKHPKRDEGFRRRRAPKRTQQGRRRDGKPDVFSPSEKSVPRRRHLFFSGKIPIFVRYLIRTNE